MYKSIKIKRLALHDLAAEEQPVVKLENGAETLTNAELLSLIIGASTSKHDELEIARNLLAVADNSLANLAKMSVKDMQFIEGVGEATAKRIFSALELSKRRLSGAVQSDIPKIRHSRDAYNVVAPFFLDKNHEECWVVLMNNQHRIISSKQVSKGGISETTVDPKIVLRYALEAKASALVIAHNHPAGNPSPSEHDTRITKKLKISCEALDIQFTDHIIYCEDGQYYSFADEAKL